MSGLSTKIIKLGPGVLEATSVQLKVNMKQQSKTTIEPLS
jgi:hypothetical protein